MLKFEYSKPMRQTVAIKNLKLGDEIVYNNANARVVFVDDIIVLVRVNEGNHSVLNKRYAGTAEASVELRGFPVLKSFLELSVGDLVINVQSTEAREFIKLKYDQLLDTSNFNLISNINYQDIKMYQVIGKLVSHAESNH